MATDATRGTPRRGTNEPWPEPGPNPPYGSGKGYPFEPYPVETPYDLPRLHENDDTYTPPPKEDECRDDLVYKGSGIASAQSIGNLDGELAYVPLADSNEDGGEYYPGLKASPKNLAVTDGVLLLTLLGYDPDVGGAANPGVADFLKRAKVPQFSNEAWIGYGQTLGDLQHQRITAIAPSAGGAVWVAMHEGEVAVFENAGVVRGLSKINKASGNILALPTGSCHLTAHANTCLGQGRHPEALRDAQPVHG